MDTQLGFLGTNLTHGVIGQPGRVLATGVCFPDRPTIQSTFPLLAVKDLLDNDQADVAYVALPVFAYAGAGIARRRQYLEVLGLMKRLFGGDLGERVYIIPDSREEIMVMKYQISNLTSRLVGDGPAREKYPYENLFAYFETASYGADIMLAALAEQRDPTIVADFRQFESIHAGIRMGKGAKYTPSALLYTLINPRVVDGKIREVSQDEQEDLPTIEDGAPGIPENSHLLYQSASLLTNDEAIELYDRVRKGRNVEDIAERVHAAKRRLLGVNPVTADFARSLEDHSIAKMKSARDVLSEDALRRTHIDQRDMHRGVIYEYK